MFLFRFHAFLIYKCLLSEKSKRLLSIFCAIAEAEMQQLSHALKILSETEKQLRMSKNQTTWLTVALLQLSSVGPSLDSGESRLCMKAADPKGENK